MKWNEMSTVRRIVFVLGWICGISYIVLAFFDLFDFLPASKAAVYPLFGIYWLCMGINLKSKKLAIWYYALAAAWFLLSLLWFFFP